LRKIEPGRRKGVWGRRKRRRRGEETEQEV
jgi:hypothetical protein